MSSQLSAQAITAQTAITRISVRRCSILPWQRGSSTTPRCRTRLSMDMILSSQPRGHVIIQQARASDRNFMRLPCFLVRRSPMSLRLQQPVPPVPDDTARIARAAFPRGNPYVLLRNRLGPVFDDAGCADLYAQRGQPGYTPWRLALVTLLQFREGRSDR